MNKLSPIRIFFVLALSAIIIMLAHLLHDQQDLQKCTKQQATDVTEKKEQFYALVDSLSITETKDSTAEVAEDTFLADKRSPDDIENYSWCDPRRDTVSHIEFIELLQELTERRPTDERQDYPFNSSMRAGAAPGSKIFWESREVCGIEESFRPFAVSDNGRKGKVFIKLDGKPTIQALCYTLKPMPWDVLLLGPTFHEVTRIILTSYFEWEDAWDMGGYLEQKGLAMRLKNLDLGDPGCSSKWYEVRLPAKGNKKHQPFWICFYMNYGISNGDIFIYIDYHKPTENLFKCEFEPKYYQDTTEAIYI